MNSILKTLIKRYPPLAFCENEIRSAAELLIESYKKGGKLLLCGNGGSASDADHIVGELMKSFSKKRTVDSELAKNLRAISETRGDLLASTLEGALPAVSLNAHGALLSAILNDIGGDFVFAQQVVALGKKGDVLLAISTSGNSQNVIDACIVAKAKGVSTLGLIGEMGGELKNLCDVAICVPAVQTAEVQEYHLPIYHALCITLEETFF
ncbi:D-sedoheptulose-7-phosphate isomerase [Ulvibacterium marinum]|uniref:SIS domain-containing protein n=1 Tax=Ulvibacterium marinum TaxID=2419782 RepID=A0A3B0CB32_9FLAO|nr:SIS domain-containing protein [Ulvibacterium marinum]RKN80767.1 SIS domain-containing protein [Ulvibacterium marinum]